MLSTDPARTISSGLRGHDNALGLIRLVLALAVLVSHTFPLGGFGHDPGSGITKGQANLGSLAVAGFFAISGYLITKSGASSDLMQFLWRRVLRIFPAFLLVLLLSAFALGPVIWMLDGHSLPAYFARGGASPWHYIASNWTLAINSWGIHDIFQQTTPYGRMTGMSVFNGSMWTLGIEWACYLMVAILLVAGVLAKARPVVIAVAAVLFAGQLVQLVSPGAMGNVLPQLGNSGFLQLAFPFAVGAVFAVYSRSIPLTPASASPPASCWCGRCSTAATPSSASRRASTSCSGWPPPSPAACAASARRTTFRTASTSTPSRCSRRWPTPACTSSGRSR